METQDFETSFKVVVVGNGNVGKSTLIRRFCKDQFIQSYKKTIGVEYLEREITIQVNEEEQSVRVMVWDCAGQEEFDKITRDYYQGADAVILAFSATDRASLEMIKRWKSKIETVLNVHHISAVLVQTKSDLVNESVLDPKEAEALARELKLRFYRISSKDNVNVDDVFRYLAESHLKRKREKQSAIVMSPQAELFQIDVEPVKDSAATAGSPAAEQVRPVTQRTGGKKDKCVLQ